LILPDRVSLHGIDCAIIALSLAFGIAVRRGARRSEQKAK
jgi:hypothetical protein